MAGLKVRLKRQAASAGSGVAHAFLRAQALLFGGYRDALQSPAVSDARSRENITLSSLNAYVSAPLSCVEGRASGVLQRAVSQS